MILSYRILPPRYETDDQFEQLRAFLRQHRAAVDEVSLFTEYWHHAYFPLPQFAQRADLLRARMDRLRHDGIGSVGANMLDTLGHMNEAWDFLPPLPFQPMVGHDGSLSRSCACPNSEAFRAYIREKYRLLARAAPDFIWVDDDLRMHHHGVAWGCFCPTCLRLFGQGEDRAALVTALDRPENASLRQAWVARNAAVLEDLLRDIAQVIRDESRVIEIGLMTAGPAWTTYSGQAFERWMRALGATRLRPGGGFYDDRTPTDMLPKALDIGRQCLRAPAGTAHVAYELENFPYQKLDKSVVTVMNECLLALATGCNGIAFNCLKDLPGDLEDYHPLLHAIAHHRPLWQAFLSAAEGLPLAGLWPAWNDEWSARRPLRAGQSWFAYDGAFNVGQLHVLAEIGLPVTIDPAGAVATVLWGGMVGVLSDDDLRRILAGGVILDPAALAALHQRNLGQHTGVGLGRPYDNGVWERLDDHPLNGRHAHSSRDARVSFWPVPAQELLPLTPDVQVLARLVGYDGSDRGPCQTVYANDLGGRVATLGYAPWQRLGNTAKRTQMLEIGDWVSRRRLPLRINQTVRVVPLVRQSADGSRFAIVLLNASLDSTGPLTVRLRAAAARIVMAAPNGNTELTCESGEGEQIVRLPGLDPWRAVVLLGSPA